ncbi:MAG: aminotransferase class I/II-fold pyridoxal phosphate-dependent enzyme [Promethearchaeota archaeon]
MVSERIKGLSYAIRDVAAEAIKLKRQGKKIYHLNIGDPVIYDFKTPDYITQAMAEAAYANQNYYVDSLGVQELREEIAKLERQKNTISITEEDILITQGVTEGIFFVLAGLMEKGNEILIPGPSYPVYINYSHFFEGTPIEYQLEEDNNWDPNIDDIRKKITEKTQAILIGSPNNPTGVVYTKSKVKEIIDIAGEYNLPIISDEIYDQIIYEKEYACPASLAKDVSVIGMNGFSKAHMATGWRLGYLYYHDPNNRLEDLKAGIENLARARLCANSAAQFAAIETLKNPGPHTDEMVRKLKERRDYSYKRLRQIEGLTINKPEGAFYMFPRIDLKEFDKWNNDKEFVLDLLRTTGICGVYGSGFGNYGKDHFRLTFLPDLKLLEHVYNLLEKFLK